MHVQKQGRLKGSFKGWRRGNVFEFASGGGNWEQVSHEYHYHYAYQPSATLFQDGSKHYLQVEGMSDRVEVRRL